MDWFDTVPAVESEDFTTCPVLLVHPAEDRWTPLRYSKRFLDRVAAPTTAMSLDNACHLPVEEPGLTQIRAAIQTFVAHVVP